LAESLKSFRSGKSTFEPPSPKELFRYAETDEGKLEITGLRANKEMYSSFLLTFGKAVHGKDFLKRSISTPISQFMPEVLESFLILAYTNGYARWKNDVNCSSPTAIPTENECIVQLENSIRETSQEADTLISSLTSCSTNMSFLFTGNAQGAKKGEGWSEEGMKIHAAVFDKIQEQRKDESHGKSFETDFMVLAAGGSSNEDGGAYDEYARDCLSNCQIYGF